MAESCSSVSAMAECSRKNPEKVINFSAAPAYKLVHSFSSLCDSEFNPRQMARLDITEKGLEITVRNSKTDVSGTLILKSSGLTNFYCSKPIVGKMINVLKLFLLSVHATNVVDDVVTIYLLQGSDCLTFIFGAFPEVNHDLKLYEMNEQIERIPDITEFFCEAVFPSGNLWRMTNVLKDSEDPDPVSLTIQEERVLAFIGKLPILIYDFTDEKFSATRGVAPGQRHHALFKLPHLSALRKASSVELCFLWCFLNEPARRIMIRFCLKELGDLVFFINALLIVPNGQDGATKDCSDDD